MSDQVTLAYCVNALDKVEEEVFISDWLVVTLLYKKSGGSIFFKLYIIKLSTRNVYKIITHIKE